MISFKQKKELTGRFCRVPADVTRFSGNKASQKFKERSKHFACQLFDLKYEAEFKTSLCTPKFLFNYKRFDVNERHPQLRISKLDKYRLSVVFFQTIHDMYDWFLVLPDTAYVNPFELMKFVNHVNWNRRSIIGGKNDEVNGHCNIHAGMLLTNPAMQTLIE